MSEPSRPEAPGVGVEPCPYDCEPVNPPFLMTDDIPRHYVLCDSCGARGPRCQTKRQAIAAWNTHPHRARIAVLEGAWQPIKTAPKEGTYIIGSRWSPHGEMIWLKDVTWLTAEQAAEADGCPSEADDYEAGWSCEGDPCFPTHWMPLPAPPALSPSDGKGVDRG